MNSRINKAISAIVTAAMIGITLIGCSSIEHIKSGNKDNTEGSNVSFSKTDGQKTEYITQNPESTCVSDTSAESISSIITYESSSLTPSETAAYTTESAAASPGEDGEDKEKTYRELFSFPEEYNEDLNNDYCGNGHLKDLLTNRCIRCGYSELAYEDVTAEWYEPWHDSYNYYIVRLRYYDYDFENRTVKVKTDSCGNLYGGNSVFIPAITPETITRDIDKVVFNKEDKEDEKPIPYRVVSVDLDFRLETNSKYFVHYRSKKEPGKLIVENGVESVKYCFSTLNKCQVILEGDDPILLDSSEWPCIFDFVVSENKPVRFADYGLRCSITKDLYLPEGTTGLPECLLPGNRFLESIRIPGGVSYIAANALEECIYLTDVYYGGTVERWKSFGVSGVYAVVHCIDGDVEGEERSPMSTPPTHYTVSP